MGAGEWPRPLEEEGSVKVGAWQNKSPLIPQKTECDPKAKAGVKPLLRTLWECTEMGKLRHKVVDPPFMRAQAKPLTQGMGAGRLTQQHHRRCGVWVLGLKGSGTEF